MRKKIIMMLSLIAVAAAVCLCIGCNCDGSDDGGEETEIVLSFDKATAYINASTELLPIKGDTLTADDRFEQTTVKISSTVAVKMQLSVKISESTTTTDGIKVTVDGGAARDLAEGTVLYESATAETEKTLNVKVYVAKDAPETLKNKSIGFYFVLTYWE